MTVTVGHLRRHLEGPDHNAVLGPRLPVWLKTHKSLHMTVNRGWRALGLISARRPTRHELDEAYDHELQEVD